MRKKPAKKVPVILPIVDKAYRLPAVAPEVLTFSIRKRTAYGDTIPRSILAGENKRTDINNPLIRISRIANTKKDKNILLKIGTNASETEERPNIKASILK